MWRSGHVTSCFLGNGVRSVLAPRRQYVWFVFGASYREPVGSVSHQDVQARLQKAISRKGPAPPAQSARSPAMDSEDRNRSSTIIATAATGTTAPARISSPPTISDDDRRPTQQVSERHANGVWNRDELVRTPGKLRVSMLPETDTDNQPERHGMPSRIGSQCSSRSTSERIPSGWTPIFTGGARPQR
jgi:hypothetical protein